MTVWLPIRWAGNSPVFNSCRATRSTTFGRWPARGGIDFPFAFSSSMSVPPGHTGGRQADHGDSIPSRVGWGCGVASLDPLGWRECSGCPGCLSCLASGRASALQSEVTKTPRSASSAIRRKRLALCWSGSIHYSNSNATERSIPSSLSQKRSSQAHWPLGPKRLRQLMRRANYRRQHERRAYAAFCAAVSSPSR
jgi:hypothetical protein